MPTRGPKDRRMQGQMGQTLFYGNIRTTARFQKKIFRKDLGLKGPVIFGQIGTNMVKQEFFWIKKQCF